MKATSSTQVAASAAYKRQRVWIACPSESNSNTRSYNSTISGTVAIDSFEAIPRPHASTEATVQPVA